MNNMKGALKEMQDKFNSRNLPTADTLSGIKTAISMDAEIRRAIRIHDEKEKKSTVSDKGNSIVTGKEAREFFER